MNLQERLKTIREQRAIQYPNLKTREDIKNLFPQFIEAAQNVYDYWDESEEFGGGGICDLIADVLIQVLVDNDVECSSSFDFTSHHCYVVLQIREGVYSLNIPFDRYERGGFYNWKKIPNVIFNNTDLILFQIDCYPENFWNYVE